MTSILTQRLGTFGFLMRDTGTITGGKNELQGTVMAYTSVNGSSFYKTNLRLTHLKRPNAFKTLIGLSPRGDTCQNLDRDARPIFLGLKFGQILFFWVGKFFSYFSGFCKISAIFLGLTNFQLFFLGLPIFVSHT